MTSEGLEALLRRPVKYLYWQEANEEANAARRALDEDALRLSDGCCRMLPYADVWWRMRQAMLAGADYMKMGYVSRNHAKDNQHHFVLGTILYRPADFATQVYVWVYVCVYVWLNVCMYVHICLYTYMYIYVCMYVCICIHVYVSSVLTDMFFPLFRSTWRRRICGVLRLPLWSALCLCLWRMASRCLIIYIYISI